MEDLPLTNSYSHQEDANYGPSPPTLQNRPQKNTKADGRYSKEAQFNVK